MYLPPLGSRGFILGEIFGLKAGLTKVEVMLFLFLGSRLDFESPLLDEGVKAGLVGVDMPLSMGLGLPVKTAEPGVPCADNLGVFRADRRGVSCSPPSWIVVSRCVKEGRVVRDASGNVKSSKCGVISEDPNVGEGWIRISDAGVAGVIPWPEAW